MSAVAQEAKEPVGPPASNGDAGAQNGPPPKKRAPKRKGQNYAEIHRKPLPLETFPVPAFIPSHPGSLFRLAYFYLSQFIWPPSSRANHSYIGYFSPQTRSVHITDPVHVRALWEMGFFGKGTLSRSEPSWMAREKARLKAEKSKRGGGTAEEATRARREDRRLFKLERARLEREKVERQRAIEAGAEFETDQAATTQDAQVRATETLEAEAVQEVSTADPPHDGTQASNPVKASPAATNNARIKVEAPTVEMEPDDIDHDIDDQEHLQLTLEEAFFLSYGLGVLTVIDSEEQGAPSPKTHSPRELLGIFGRHSTFPPLPLSKVFKLAPDNAFLINYVVYHHFRSLGWVVRPGVKFSVDYLLYNRGPVFSHAEFAILILASYSHAYWKSGPGASERRIKHNSDWWWLHCINRVQSQVRKTLVLVYVDIPPPAGSSSGYDDIGQLLRGYKVREFVIRRWVANRSRD